MGRADSPLGGRMVFVVGAPRSGTLWMQRIVTAHREVSAVPSETFLFSHGIEPLFERFHHGAKASPQVGSVYLERDRLLDLARDLCDAAFGQYLAPGVRLLVERTPAHASHLGLISEVYPDARAVHIIRDGRDVARSIATQDWGPDDLAGAARMWREAVSDARTAGLDDERYCEVRYETLLGEPRPAIAALYEWLGLDSTDADVEQGLAEARRRANVNQFARGGVAAGKWREALGPRELEEFEREAGDLAAELGYAQSAAGAGPAAAAGAPAPAQRRKRLRRSLRTRRAPAGGQFDRQALTDGVIEALRERDRDRLADLLHPDALVIVQARGARGEARGPQALQMLESELSQGPLLRGAQTHGEVHASTPTITYLLAFEPDDADAVVLITIPDRLVTELRLYGLPLEPPR